MVHKHHPGVKMARDELKKWTDLSETTPTVTTTGLAHQIQEFLKAHVLAADAEKDGGCHKLGDTLRAIGTVVDDLKEVAANKVESGTLEHSIREAEFLRPMEAYNVWEALKFCLFRAAIAKLAAPSTRPGVGGGQLRGKLETEGELKELWRMGKNFKEFATELELTFGQPMAFSAPLKKVFQLRAGGLSVPEYAAQFRTVLTALGKAAVPTLEKAAGVQNEIERRLDQLVEGDGMLCFLWFVSGVNDEQFLRVTQEWLNQPGRTVEEVTFAHFLKLIDQRSGALPEGLLKFCAGGSDAKRLKQAGGRGGPPRMGLAAMSAAGRGRGKGRGRGNTRGGHGGGAGRGRGRGLGPLRDESPVVAAIRARGTERAVDQGRMDPAYEYPNKASTFRMVCFSCGYRGHFASVCKRVPPPSLQQPPKQTAKAKMASLVSNAQGAEELNSYNVLAEYDSEGEYEAGESSDSEGAAVAASIASLRGQQMSEWLRVAPTRQGRAALFASMSGRDMVERTSGSGGAASSSGGGAASSGDGQTVGFAPLSAEYVEYGRPAAAAVAAVDAAPAPFLGWPVTPGVEDTTTVDAVIGGQDVVKVYLAGSEKKTPRRLWGGAGRRCTEREVLELFALKMLVDTGAQSCVMLGAVADVLLAELGGGAAESLVDENPAPAIEITTGSGAWRSTRRIHAAVRMHDLGGAPGPDAARSCVPITFVIVDNPMFELPGGQFAILGAPFIRAFHSFVVEEHRLRFVTKDGEPHVCLWKYTPAHTSSGEGPPSVPPSATDRLREAENVAYEDVEREGAAADGKPYQDEHYDGEPWSGIGDGPLSASKGRTLYTGYGSAAWVAAQEAERRAAGAGAGTTVAAGAGAGAAGGEGTAEADAAMPGADAPPPADF